MDLDQIVADAQKAFEHASDITTLENEKARFLGKSGALTELLKGLGKLDPETRKTEGVRINVAKQQVEAALTARRQALADALLNQRLAAEAIDVTLPGRGAGAGSLHPVMRTWERVEQVFHSIGFDVADGPEIETDWYNFTSLNSPENHPARSMQDTFYIDGKDADGRQL
ncbi:MAG: phenylalanine--tRNA ligase subunit alpha, partial [Paraburkholderia sp.]|nr:phenylalanine--tRNA ligase subunit alpha [Paraburkholderia sp.]